MNTDPAATQADDSKGRSAAATTNGNADTTLIGLDDAPKLDAQSLDGYLITVGETIVLPEMRTRLRTHLVPTDVNGHLQNSKLAQMLADLVTDYCIPRHRRAEAMEECRRTGSTEPLNALRREAVDLFVDSETTGEPGELLLYLLTERMLGAPQILSKMVLKTSTKLHYQGADGVHAKRTEAGLALYWGESKIHADRAAAVRDCLRSVAPFLTDPDRKAGTRDLGLVRDNLDVEGKELRDAMVRFFIQSNPEWNQLELRASCLVGFNLAEYPKFSEPTEIEPDSEIKQLIEGWRDHLRENIENKELKTFSIDFFMVPFESVEEFRTQTLEALGIK